MRPPCVCLLQSSPRSTPFTRDPRHPTADGMLPIIHPVPTSSPAWPPGSRPSSEPVRERIVTASGGTGARGSSPRVRGTRQPRPMVGLPIRFIPARAGNAVTCTSRRTRRAVHPRACGERGYRGTWRSLPGGSSPRVRGTPTQSTDAVGTPRFIPARAGNASWRQVSRDDAPVHPRACGERIVIMPM